MVKFVRPLGIRPALLIKQAVNADGINSAVYDILTGLMRFRFVRDFIDWVRIAGCAVKISRFHGLDREERKETNRNEQEKSPDKRKHCRLIVKKKRICRAIAYE
jgi:hypothetical protein